jgi:hypothetical protein
MSATHTPGPWRIVEHGGQVIAGTVSICNTFEAVSYPNEARSENVRRWKAEHAANARLIAAAPELLATLRLIARDDFNEAVELTACKELARAAIAKAEAAA